jgi:hypothetical protein
MAKEKMQTAPISLADVKMGGERTATTEADERDTAVNWSEML